MESGSGEVSELSAGDASLGMAKLDGHGADERLEMADSR